AVAVNVHAEVEPITQLAGERRPEYRAGVGLAQPRGEIRHDDLRWRDLRHSRVRRGQSRIADTGQAGLQARLGVGDIAGEARRAEGVGSYGRKDVDGDGTGRGVTRK